MMQPVWTFEDVIDVLGGPSAVARLTYQHSQSIPIWRKQGSFPTRYYFVMKCALADRGYYAPLSLWAFYGELGKIA